MTCESSKRLLNRRYRASHWSIATKPPFVEGSSDLPDADRPGFVALNGGFRAENRSPTGQNPSMTVPK